MKWMCPCLVEEEVKRGKQELELILKEREIKLDFFRREISSLQEKVNIHEAVSVLGGTNPYPMHYTLFFVGKCVWRSSQIVNEI